MNFVRNIVLLSLILITGCAIHHNNELDKLFDGTKSTKLKAKKILFDESQTSLDFMFELQYIDSILLVNEFPNPWHCMKIVNLRTGEVFPFAEKGRGPGQINGQAVDYSLDYKNRELYIMDKKSYNIFSLDSIVKYHASTRGLKHFSVQFNNEHFIRPVYNGGRIVGGMYDKQFGVFDIKYDTIIKKGDYQEGGAMAWQSFYLSHPSQDIVAYFNYLSAGMGLLDLTLDFNINVFEILAGESNASTQVEGNTLKTKPIRGAKNGHIAACASNQFIYVLYSGKKINQSSLETLTSSFLSNRVYVFDWSGKPVKYYDLDCNVRSIAVDPKDEIIYAASYQNIPCLVYFDLKK